MTAVTALAAALRVAAPVGVVATLTVKARPAAAQAVRVQFSTRVGAGEQPRVTLVFEQAVDAVSVELQGGTGEPVRARFGALARGARREVLLPAIPGRQRWRGTVSVRQGSQSSDSPLEFETVTAPRLEISVDKARVDLPGRRLEARFSRPAVRAEVKVFSAVDGALLAEETLELAGQEAGSPLVLGWPAPARGGRAAAADEVGRIELRLTDPDGFYAGVALHPWSVRIPHEEVAFATDSATIDPAERPKLEASYARVAEALARHRSLGPVRLYIAGHTDTVGTPAYNLGLSQRRAQAIAAWFRGRGLRLPVLYEGFGEAAPLVATADETAEARNRRVDYILAVEDPVLPATRHRAVWKRPP